MNRDKWIHTLGQRLSVGFDGYDLPNEYAELVKRYQVGNAILFRRNVKDYDQLGALCQRLHDLMLSETGMKPFIMIDEECGSVSRLAHVAAPTPCAMAIGATGDEENAYRIGKIVGEELRSVGVNFNLAPVLDCSTHPDNAVMTNRCFSRDPETTARFGLRYIQGLRDAGVLACGKHFPGHGDTAVDSHLALPVVEKSMDEVRKCELVSFSAAIRAGIDAIMSAHVVFPAMEPERIPSTVSRRVITGLLRNELGFDGIVVSDGMEMNAVKALFGMEEGVRRALCAGVDVALVCHSPAQGQAAMEHLIQSVTEGRMDEGECQASFDRIRRKKESLPGPAGGREMFGSPEQRETARRIMDQSIRVLSAPDGRPLPRVDENTLYVGVPGLAASQANDFVPLDAAKRLSDALGGRCARPEDIQGASLPSCAVVTLSRSQRMEEVLAAARALDGAGVPVIAVSMHTPRCLEALPDSVWKVGAWQHDLLSADALARFLKSQADHKEDIRI